ncbi:MAG: hypothetical protein EP329_07955 [Deltaproteobacteria bacterium]|nr:MAG: hypothetical protein EP329_07955 [Deltaproteobacteria bacterium]
MTPPEAPDAGLVMWFRQDVRRAVRGAWLRAFVFVLLAMVFLAPPLSAWESPDALVIGGWILGGACLLTGPIYLLVKLHRILAPEVYIAVHRGGIRWRRDSEQRFLAWPQIRGFEALLDRPGLVVATDDGGTLVIAEEFVDVSSADLAALLSELHQKALLGLPIRPRVWPPS